MSWKTVTVGDVCSQLRGVSYGKDDVVESPEDGYEMLFRGNNISPEGIINYDKLVYVKQDCVSEKQFLQRYDVLITASTGSKKAIGKNAVFTDSQRVSFGAFCKVLRPNTSLVCPLFFGLFFKRIEYKHYIENIVEGANINNIKNSHLDDMVFPLPSLAVQRKLSDVLQLADTLRQQCQQMDKELSALTQSVFLEMFGDPKINPMNWPLATIGNCCASVNYGSSSKASEEIRQYPILRMGNITYDGDWDLSSLKYVDLSKDEEKKYLVEDGDLLFNRTNSRELVGKTAVYRNSEPMAFAGYLVRARCNESAVPEYISAFMNSRYGKQILLNMCKSIVGMANINAKEFQRIALPLPPKNIQVKFQKRILEINKKRSEISKIKAAYNNLFNALMQRAFKGELKL